MGLVLLTSILGFFAVEGLGYAFHKFLHSRWAGSLNRAHMTHHLTLYPPQDYLSDGSYRDPGKDSTMYRFLVFGIIVAGLLFWLTPPWFSIPMALNLAVLGGLNAYIHDALHVRGHWLERYSLYRRWREIHYVHHVHMGTNFGIITFVADRILGTYRAPGSSGPIPNR